MELPTSPKRGLAIAMLRAIDIKQKDTARYTRCANQTVVDTEKWLREADYHRVARICDDQSIKKMVTAEAIYWGLEEENLVKLDRLTQDDVLRHYRADYLEIVDMSDPRFLKHTVNVLNLLDTYASQLRMGYEPEHFLPPPEKEIPDDRWLDYWAYVKDVVPSIDSLINDQIDSENIHIAAQIEMEPPFAALEGHYEGTELWESIKSYKQARDAYAGAGVRLHKIVTTEISRFSLQVPEETKVFLEAIRNLVQIEATQTRVKLNIELIETDLGTTLENLPDNRGKALQRFLELENKYKNKPHSESKNDVQEAQNVGKLILELMVRLEKNYEPVKRLYKAITRAAEGEKLKGTLPPGSKCKFCPAA